MTKKQLIVRNPLGQREAIAPEAIRPQPLTEANVIETNQQGNKETIGQSVPQIEAIDEELPKKPALKRYATYLRPESIKCVQYEAIEKDCSDYDIVQTAIDEYFAERKSKVID